MAGRRSDDEITLFESQGIALMDVAAASPSALASTP